jgi:membrane protease subunit HflC
MKGPIIIIAFIVLLAIFVPQLLFTVDETESVVVTRFGQVKNVITVPGLNVKTPFMDSVTRFDSRLLRVDMTPETMANQEKENLVIDAYARYRIVDPQKFLETLRNESNAAGRIGAIVISSLREEIARNTMADIIGATIEEIVVDGKPKRSTTATETRTLILGKVLKASQHVIESSDNDFGVVLIDVRMKRADFSDDIARSVFNLMESERKRIAEEFRAEGREENVKIRAKVDKDRVLILAEAEKQANILKGDGEAKAIEIFASALEQDPEFYSFQRSLEAYGKFLVTNSTVVFFFRC